MIGEFRAFLLKSNALALAIGVIIGTALGTVVNSLVCAYPVVSGQRKM